MYITILYFINVHTKTLLYYSLLCNSLFYKTKHYCTKHYCITHYCTKQSMGVVFKRGFIARSAITSDANDLLCSYYDLYILILCYPKWSLLDNIILCSVLVRLVTNIMISINVFLLTIFREEDN